MDRRTARRIGRRLAEIGLTLLGVAVLVFITLRVLPGDQITASLGVEAGDMSEGQLAALRAYYGMDQPTPSPVPVVAGERGHGQPGLSTATPASRCCR